MESFQNGVDSICNSCSTYGSTPANNTPNDIITSIESIYINRYTEGYTTGESSSKVTGVLSVKTVGTKPSNIAVIAVKVDSSGTSGTQVGQNGSFSSKVAVLRYEYVDPYYWSIEALTDLTGTINLKKGEKYRWSYWSDVSIIVYG